MALYRKYRPATFAEVVGQSHVTEPLSVALDSGRINHAYLFSGPRGCGKTSSARILARSLNCVEGPTSTPCGKCDSCVSLAPGGPGNLDVTELDAATHNGVDDMRELRERAFYAPAESRYRVFIIDEAHMISTAGFNALLKIVEEPPEHLIFIFATTEPEKLLQTIRSRTHNYPFRLLTPPDMRNLLTSVVQGEGVEVEDAVYPLVIRAGGGSPRDSLSIMDQLLAGAGSEGVTYNRALALLGVTDITLIDNAVVALANQDQAGLFGVVDEVIEAGYDPRRFAEDLLDRFRDLLVLQAVPDAIDRGLVNAPADAKQSLEEQSRMLGQATLTRCAALVNEGLAQMRGATAPRLLLEILCARMALPAAGLTVEALAQRVEALEQGRGGSPAALGASAAAGQAPNLSSGKKYERPSRRRQPDAAQPQSAEGNAGGAAPQERREGQGAPAAQPAQPAQSAQSLPAQQATESRETQPAQTAPEQQPEQQPEPAQTAAPEQQQGSEQVEHDEVEPPEVAEARKAREIMDRNRQSSAPTSSPVSTPTAAAPSAASQETSQPEPAADADKAITADQWTDVLNAVKDADLSAWIALRDATLIPEQPTPGEIHVTHHTGALANFVNNDRNRQVYSTAIESITGIPATVVANGAHRESPGKAPRPEPEPSEPRPQRSSHNPIPAETDTDVTTIRTAATSALERAKAMEAALSDAAIAAGGGQGDAGGVEKNDTPPSNADVRKSRHRERAERARAKRQYNQENGFGGVPLPDEPPEDPWDAAPPEDFMPEAYPQHGQANAGGPAGKDNVQARAQAPAQVRQRPAQQMQQTHQAQQSNQPPRDTGDEQRRRLEDEMVESLRNGPGEKEHRSPLEIAGDLIEQHLGAKRVR